MNRSQPQPVSDFSLQPLAFSLPPVIASASPSDPRQFLTAAKWGSAELEPISGDASARRYFRLRKGSRSAVLMDASNLLDTVGPFIQINEHLQKLGFSVPTLLAWDTRDGFLLLEDFGDKTFTRLLEGHADIEKLYTIATDVLIALHRNPRAIPPELRAYHPEKMLEDIELFLEWRTPGISEAEKAEFRAAWREVLPQAHQIPATLLLRDYHAANLMLLPRRRGVRKAGLLDFQDAYQGPITYDLVSLFQDARHDIPEQLRNKMMARYLAAFPKLDRAAFAISTAILAAQRHTRVLAIFERLSRRDGKHDYKRLHSRRVESLLRIALEHPVLAGVKCWMERHAR